MAWSFFPVDRQKEPCFIRERRFEVNVLRYEYEEKFMKLGLIFHSRRTLCTIPTYALIISYTMSRLH